MTAVNVMATSFRPIFFALTSSILSHKRQFIAQNFWRKYFENHNTGPNFHTLNFDEDQQGDSKRIIIISFEGNAFFSSKTEQEKVEDEVSLFEQRCHFKSQKSN
jgi:hypothetical protein